MGSAGDLLPGTQVGVDSEFDQARCDADVSRIVMVLQGASLRDTDSYFLGEC